MALTTGTQIGHYEIRSPIGEGGMGEVYSAWDSKLKREVAIKVLPEAFIQDRDRVSRFQREAEILASLNHPHIAAIYDLQNVGGTQFLVLELIDGETLTERLARAPFSVEEAIKIATEIAGALETAHEKGIIHRDIKADNIMLTRRQHSKILDFGLAKQSAPLAASDVVTLNSLTSTEVIAGTPQYLSPEVLQGATADARSDLWAFGVVLYQMLSGRLPFAGATFLEISSAILKDSPPPLPAGVPPPLRAIVSQCLEKIPDQRYSNASQIRTALEELQSAAPSIATVSRRNWLWIAAAAVVMMASGVVWWQTRTAPAKMLSTGGPPSSNPEANDLFELAMNLSAVQN